MPKRKFVRQREPEKSSSPGMLSYFKLGESYTNLILGAIVVIAIGIVIVAFVRNNKQEQTSSTVNGSSMEKTSEETTSSTYTIKTGDSLWSISEKVYKTGYSWKQIAKANNLENPGLIHVGNTLKLPRINNETAVAGISDQKEEIKDKTTVNNAITEDKYTIKKGDNLWNIAVRAYGDGFRYVEIAKANNLANPRLIHSDNVLIIPRT